MSLAPYCPGEYRPAPSTMASFADNDQFPWMEVALGEMGIRERRGEGRHNPRIVEYISSVNRSIQDDETAWCSAFVNWVMSEIGLRGSRRLNARSWTTWGNTVPTSSPQYGAITVLWRVSPSSWKGHVGFYCGEANGKLILLGGNQGNKVSLKEYPRERLLTYRWPSAFPEPNISVGS